MGCDRGGEGGKRRGGGGGGGEGVGKGIIMQVDVNMQHLCS